MESRPPTLANWLKDRCQQEHLSLRKASAMTDLSHSTLADIINGGRASAETIKKLALAFGDGNNNRLALEDKLLILAGHRSQRPEGDSFSEPLAQLLDKISQFDEEKLKLMQHFADFISRMEKR